MPLCLGNNAMRDLTRTIGSVDAEDSSRKPLGNPFQQQTADPNSRT